MFIDNKYTRTYYSIIEKYSSESIEGYVEKHHIIPKSLGGTDDPSNIVPLPARVHFICHRLLPRMLSGKEKSRMKMAEWTMARTRNNIRITNRTYELIRIQAALNHSLLLKGKKLGPLTEEHKRKLSEAQKKRYEDPAERSKTSLLHKGKVVSKETRRKLSEARKLNPPKHVPSMAGKKHSEETKQKMRDAWIKRKGYSSSSSLI